MPSECISGEDESELKLGEFTYDFLQTVGRILQVRVRLVDSASVEANEKVSICNSWIGDEGRRPYLRAVIVMSGRRRDQIRWEKLA
jgi:hypothetical protein